MTNLTKPAALTFAVLASVLSFGATSASAAACDGTWTRSYGHRLEKQCYYLPTVSNGRVTGLELKENYRLPRPTPGATIGGVIPPAVHHHPPK
jgi:hypothetical protein